MPSTVDSKVASSTRVEIAEMTAFHSSEVLVLAKNTKLDHMPQILKLNVMRSFSMYYYILYNGKIE